MRSGAYLVRVKDDSSQWALSMVFEGQFVHYLIDKPTTTLTLWATYNTDMKRINGEWKIARHHLESRGTRIQAD